ncbi:MAG: hypothetical protein ACN6OP_05410 [Pseudomonadales bacterium]
MTPGIQAALVTVLVLGMWFNVTRPMSIAAAAALTFMYPLLLILILIGAGIALWVGYFRK